MALMERWNARRTRTGGWSFPKVASWRHEANTQARTEERFYHSLRFRLAVWFAFVIFLIVLATGLVVSNYVERNMLRDTDERLLDSAYDIYQNRTQTFPFVEGLTLDEINQRDPITKYIAVPPKVDDLVLSGLWIQYVDYDGTVTEFPSDTSASAAQTPDEDSPAPSVIFPTEILDRVDTTDAIASGVTELHTVQASGQRARILIYPMTLGVEEDDLSDTVIIGAIVIGLPIDTQINAIEVINRVLLVCGAFGVVLAAMAGWIIAGWALSPVNRIIRAAQSIAGRPNSPESLAIRIAVPRGADEMSLLASTFNTMLSRIEDAFRGQRRFVADASHELRTPLTAIRGNVDVILRQSKSGREIPGDILNDSLEDVHRESARMARLIDDLLTLARSDAQGESHGLQLDNVRLDELAAEVHGTLEPIAGDVTLTLDDNEPVSTMVDRDRLVQVMIILGENAIRHTPAGGTVTVSVNESVDPESGVDVARITVSDTGEGISAEHLPHLFERFYRAEDARARGTGGTGLGLSIALGIVRAHGGWIDVETAPGQGSTFEVSIPLER